MVFKALALKIRPEEKDMWYNGFVRNSNCGDKYEMANNKIYSSLFVMIFNQIISFFPTCSLIFLFVSSLVNPNSVFSDPHFDYIFYLILIVSLLYTYFWLFKVKFLVYKHDSFYIGYFNRKKIKNFRFIFYLGGNVPLVFFSYRLKNRNHWGAVSLPICNRKNLVEELRIYKRK